MLLFALVLARSRDGNRVANDPGLPQLRSTTSARLLLYALRSVLVASRRLLPSLVASVRHRLRLARVAPRYSRPFFTRVPMGVVSMSTSAVAVALGPRPHCPPCPSRWYWPVVESAQCRKGPLCLDSVPPPPLVLITCSPTSTRPPTESEGAPTPRTQQGGYLASSSEAQAR